MSEFPNGEFLRFSPFLNSSLDKKKDLHLLQTADGVSLMDKSQ